jgi:spore coat polysaccharide biosynthesis protein SpsF (cytidylyltransferase family)/spore coat polysaccharide biosynthesis predicted glycosyltransferase SpsG
LSKVIAIIGARLNSSRLPSKHLLDLAGKPLIARIFERLAQVGEIDKSVLATTADAYNQPLVDWAHAAGQAVFAFGGDVNDLVGRVNAVVETEQPDFVVYICGDSPLIEPTTLSALIQTLLDNPTADHVELAPPTTGKFIHEGFIAYRRALWERIVAASQSPDAREHVGSALTGLRPGLSIIQLAEDPLYASCEHRISVDTPSDYRFMAEIYRRWYAEHPPESVVSLSWVIGEILRDEPLAATNRAVRQKAVGEHSRAILIVCQAGPGIGIGHLSRCLALAGVLQDRHFAGVHLLIQAPPVTKTGLDLQPHRFIPAGSDLTGAIRTEMTEKKYRAVILDLFPASIPNALPELLAELGQQGVLRVGIDSLHALAGPAGLLDRLCLPGFDVPQALLAACAPTPVCHGWPYYLIPAVPARPPWQPGQRVLILTGGSDATRLGEALPSEIDQALPTGSEIHWVRGPYAGQPKLPAMPRLTWHVHEAPPDLDGLMETAHYALTIYGVSLFELIQHGVPSVVFSPYGERDTEKLGPLAASDTVIVSNDAHSAVTDLARLMANPELARHLASRGPAHVDGLGPARLASDIFERLESRA